MQLWLNMVMACTVMAYVLLAYMVTAYMVMAYIAHTLAEGWTDGQMCVQARSRCKYRTR